MTTDSFLALACGGFIASMFGALMCFFGYRMFLFLLPLWGFFFGFSLGAQSIQVLFGGSFLGDVTSWVVGFVVAVIFALLSYLFYFAAIAIISGTLGYLVAVGILSAFGIEMGLLVWLIGLAAAVGMVVLTFVLNLQKWVVIISTSLAGAAVVFGAYFVIFNPHAALLDKPFRTFIGASPLLIIMTALLAAAGIVFQYVNTKRFTVETYDNWSSAA